MNVGLGVGVSLSGWLEVKVVLVSPRLLLQAAQHRLLPAHADMLQTFKIVKVIDKVNSEPDGGPCRKGNQEQGWPQTRQAGREKKLLLQQSCC